MQVFIKVPMRGNQLQLELLQDYIRELEQREFAVYLLDGFYLVFLKAESYYYSWGSEEDNPEYFTIPMALRDCVTWMYFPQEDNTDSRECVLVTDLKGNELEPNSKYSVIQSTLSVRSHFVSSAPFVVIEVSMSYGGYLVAKLTKYSCKRSKFGVEVATEVIFNSLFLMEAIKEFGVYSAAIEKVCRRLELRSKNRASEM